jgi:hypothetical protein
MVTYLSGGRIQGSSSTGATDTLGSAGDATSNDADLDTSNEKLGTGCLDFDGSEKIVANGLLNAMNTAGSISLWFNAAQDEDAILFAFCATGSNTKLEIATQTTDTISCQLKISGTQQWAVNSTSTYSNTGTWNHIVFTHNGTLPEIYINGTIASMNRSSTTDNTKWWTALRNAGANGIAIGSKAPLNGNTWNEFFEGKLDDIGIWDRALTSTEVGNLYNSGTGALATTVPSGLKVYYNCDSATVTNNAVLVDEKTTISNVPAGTRYEETDTRKIFRRKLTPAFTHSQTSENTQEALGHTNHLKAAQRIQASHPLIGKTVTSCAFNLRNANNFQSGTVVCELLESDGTFKATIGTVNVSAISTSHTAITFTGGAGGEVEADDMLALRTTGLSDSNYLALKHHTSSQEANSYFVDYVSGSWSNQTSKDLYFTATSAEVYSWVEKGTA